MKMSIEEKQARKDLRREARNTLKREERIKLEKHHNPIHSIIITIEWKKSRTYGANPHAEAIIHYKNGMSGKEIGFTCSGCGYDKESTVIAHIFNSCLKYKLWEKLEKSNPEELKNKPYGLRMSKDGVYFEDAIGTDCYYKISEYIGGKFEHIGSGKTFGIYKYSEID